jgi:hypothetical protein
MSLAKEVLHIVLLHLSRDLVLIICYFLLLLLLLLFCLFLNLNFGCW